MDRSGHRTTAKHSNRRVPLDYKPVPPPQSRGGSGLLVVGLLVSGVGIGGYYLWTGTHRLGQQQFEPLPRVVSIKDARETTGSSSAAVKSGGSAQSSNATHNKQNSAPVNREKSDATATGITPEPVDMFDFYKILPKLRVGSQTLTADSIAAKPKHPEVAKIYFLQVGAFRDGHDAEALRSKLISLGFNPKIRIVNNHKADSKKQPSTGLHRVQIGPFTDLSKVESIQRKLRRAGLASTLRQENKRAH